MESKLKKVLISCYKEEMISFLKNKTEYFDEAIELAISDDQPFAWRSAWLLWSCMEYNDNRIRKYLPRIVSSLINKNDGHQRELIKILSQMELTPKHEGILFDLCLSLWEQINKSPSVRITAMRYIVKITQKHSELKKELPFLVQEQYLSTLSPGVRHSIKKMFEELKIEVE